MSETTDVTYRLEYQIPATSEWRRMPGYTEHRKQEFAEDDMKQASQLAVVPLRIVRIERHVIETMEVVAP
jgi:hypothetical protein